mmetsp:Transcript_31006/g.47500  ORF Transcript_31006/g.47500 Transcript_31006/m.47500 type:complete len:849 (+) Transcript_31006:121-2667(+)
MSFSLLFQTRPPSVVRRLIRCLIAAPRRNNNNMHLHDPMGSRKRTIRRQSSWRTVSTSERREIKELRRKFSKEMEALPEHRAQTNLINFLEAHSKQEGFDTPLVSGRTIHKVVPPTPPPGGYTHLMNTEQIRTTLDAAMATFCLHVEARIASLMGKGFYTIGPCGEELLSSLGHAIETNDAAALHYRHLGVNILRQLRRGEVLDQILLDRARGYTVSRNDPVTGGVHCAIGSGAGAPGSEHHDYIVTSTLASQCPSAVGRALGFALANPKECHRRPISLATVGDGSVHNHHFWASYHLARHARHKRVKCPMLFGISDNGLSISYETEGYVDTLFPGDMLVPVYRAYGGDMLDIYDQTLQASRYVRQQSAPAVILYHGIIRRFGHAATDRQHAYLEKEDIQGMADTDVLASGIAQAVETMGAITYPEALDRFLEIQNLVKIGFNEAMQEEKVSREDMLETVAQPMVQVPRLPVDMLCGNDNSLDPTGKGEVMRKHMTRVIEETLRDDPSVVYIGEDVEHGGYYLVTDGLAKKFPGRVRDFPPDETTLLGAGMGFSQVGLTPIVEIPYAKYLDCGVDKFYEIALMNWLTSGQKPNGMVIRLQGFDRGTFGGNFHTHNMLSHIPPGVDMVCYSNGRDYVRGFRNAVAQAKQGRIVVLVDCTNLLNLRHLHDKDRGWERIYPTKDQHPMMSFHDIRRYGTKGKWAILSYGNGVVTSLQARKSLIGKGVIKSEDELDIIDCPYISAVPKGLKEVVRGYKGILFADICKEGPGGNVLSSMITMLHKEELLPNKWLFVGAPRTYNPLGSTATFLNVPDIEQAFMTLSSEEKPRQPSDHEFACDHSSIESIDTANK